MNIGEANQYFQLLRSMRTGADDADRERGLEAAKALTDRARKALDAGPLASEVEGLVLAIYEALADAFDLTGFDVDLGPRTVVTAQPVGGVL